MESEPLGMDPGLRPFQTTRMFCSLKAFHDSGERSSRPVRSTSQERSSHQRRSLIDAFDRPYSPNHEKPSNCKTCGGWKGRSPGSIPKGSDSVFEKSGVFVLGCFQNAFPGPYVHRERAPVPKLRSSLNPSALQSPPTKTAPKA